MARTPRSERRYHPTPRKVIVKRDVSKAETKGGLFVPQQAQKDEQVGTVLAVGDEVRGMKVGDRVVFGGMYQMLNTVGEDDIAVLLWPDELHYSFEDVVIEPTKEENDREAAAVVALDEMRKSLKLEP